MRINNKYASWLLVGLTILFLGYFYGAILISPNSYLFSTSGDGMKNYFTYITQAKETSWTESIAMNYPYGENFMYLDCQPVFTWILKTIAIPFPGVLNYSVGILNFLMILSIGISAWLLYLILRRLNINSWVSAAAALGICILAPQIFRITGHLALSYSCFIPLTWYIFIRYYTSNRKLKWSILMCVNTMFWFFTHAYLGMIVVAFIACSFLIELAMSFRKRLFEKGFWLHFFLQSILPLVVFYGFVKAVDMHIGRTTNPYGYMFYTSNFDSVFLPSHEPLKPIIDNVFTIDQIWEGWSYIGLASVLVLVFAIFFCIYRLLKTKRLIGTNRIENRLVLTAIFSSLILLFLSFGYPFKWRLEFLLDKFSIIKNFRGIGRFAWVFYYAITVGSVYFCYSFCNKYRSVRTMGLIMLIPISYVVEGIPYHMELSKEMVRTPNYFVANQLEQDLEEAISRLDNSRYQAIIPLPYYHIGSENFGKEATEKSLRLSMLLGYHSGLALMSNYSTRTSIKEAKNLMQIVSPGFYKRALQDDISDSRPFLILYTKEELGQWEEELLGRGTKIYSNDELELFEVSFQDLFKSTANDWMVKYEALKDSLVYSNGFTLSPEDTSKYVYFNSFDKRTSAVPFSGEGCLFGFKKDYTVLKEFRNDELVPGKSYVSSFWMYNQGANFGQDIVGGLLFLSIKNSQGNEEWLEVNGANGATTIYGDWSLVEYSFSAPKSDYAYKLIFKGDDYSRRAFHIDDLLIREAGVDVYKTFDQNSSKSVLFYNNQRIVF